MVGVREVAGVHLHFTREHRLHLWIHLVPRRDALVARGELAVAGDDAELLLPRESVLAELVPALVEFALVLVRPLLRDVMRGVRSARREVDEERLVRHEGFLLPDPLR